LKRKLIKFINFRFLNGKSSLISVATIGIPSFFSTYQLSDGSLVNVHLFDTAGQEKFRSLSESYYKKADCCLLVYDISKKKTFDDCRDYYNKNIIEKCKKNIKVILLGNKTDLEDQREVKPEEGAAFALENDYNFMETSCLKNENVANAFETLIEITNIESKKNINNNMNLDETIKLETDKHKNKKSKKCSCKF